MATTSAKSPAAKRAVPKARAAKSLAAQSLAARTSAAKTIGEDLDLAVRERAHKAIDRAINDLKHAVEAGETDADAMLTAAAAALGRAAHAIADETRRRSAEVTKVAAKEVRDHPVATTAIATAVVAAIAGLVLAIRQAPRKLLR